MTAVLSDTDLSVAELKGMLRAVIVECGRLEADARKCKGAASDFAGEKQAPIDWLEGKAETYQEAADRIRQRIGGRTLDQLRP